MGYDLKSGVLNTQPSRCFICLEDKKYDNILMTSKQRIQPDYNMHFFTVFLQSVNLLREKKKKKKTIQ